MSYFIKAEINGIQEFIFNIQSKGAAKSLKARSFMVDAACQLIRESLMDLFPGSTDFFTGGGNVSLEIPDQRWDESVFKKSAAEISRQLLPYQVISCFTFEKFDANINFGLFIKRLNEKLNKEKLRFSIQDLSVFAAGTSIVKEQKIFASFSKTYAAGKSSEISNCKDKSPEVITDKSIRLGNKEFILKTNGQQTLIPLPVWTTTNHSAKNKIFETLKTKEPGYEKPSPGDIISFQELGEFARERTGTDSIGVLKLDVDNLGKLFQKLAKRKDCEFLSTSMKDFFGREIINLLNEEMKTGGGLIKFLDNIYTVYAGGDDCFFIGAWDAIIEFGMKLQKKFSVFEKEIIRKELLAFPNPITLSASILVVDSHFPVIRFAEVAEENLKKAKFNKQEGKLDAAGETMKNNINFLGHTFSWDEFYELEKVKGTMYKMITDEKESKAFLHRIINSFENSDTVYWHTCKPAKPFNPAILWRFLYSFRDVQNKDYFMKKDYNTLFFSRTEGYYKKYVWQQFSPGKELSQVMPVAARWTELLTRIKTE